jgi:hypothetical protein
MGQTETEREGVAAFKVFNTFYNCGQFDKNFMFVDRRAFIAI